MCFFYSFSIFQNAHALSKLCSKYLCLFFTLSLKKYLQSSIWTLFSSSFCLHNLKSYWNARLWLQPPHISGPYHRLHRRALRLLFGALFNSPATCARVYKLKLAGFFFSSLRSVSSRFLRGRLERSLCSEQMFSPLSHTSLWAAPVRAEDGLQSWRGSVTRSHGWGEEGGHNNWY